MGDDAELVGYFGFGSLVNHHTLRTDYVHLIPATLKGWRRHWQARSKTFKNAVALLSVHPDQKTSIQGLLVIDRLANLPAVDEREEGYTRIKLAKDDLELSNGSMNVSELYVYIADEVTDAVDDGPLLQSYLDAVMQGFLINYGEEGVRHFVDTTNGFKRPVIADRDAPFYPRNVSLSDEEKLLFDQELARAGVITIPT